MSALLENYKILFVIFIHEYSPNKANNDMFLEHAMFNGTNLSMAASNFTEQNYTTSYPSLCVCDYPGDME